ncbi:MAG: CHAT domain-containing protein [Thermoguttaceae bacterium]|nr:CHAT domain-containing protein [Thermoguttaceae bacterium]MDW8080112.1 CHAT domain-containing protein [Thermoguttaceae bacterium]
MLEEAVADFESAAKHENKRLSLTGWGRPQTTALQFVVYQPWEALVDCYVQLSAPERTFSAMERYRDPILLRMAERFVPSLAAQVAPAEAFELRQRYEQAAACVSALRRQLELTFVRTDLSPEARQQTIAQLTKELDEAQFAYVQARSSILAAKFVAQPLADRSSQQTLWEELRKLRAEENPLLLEYFVGEENSYLLAVPPDGKPITTELTISEEHAKVLALRPGKLGRRELFKVVQKPEDGLLSQLQQASSEDHIGNLAPKLGVLFEVLIPEELRLQILSGQIRQLVIVPHGPLQLLPFEALVVDRALPIRFLVDMGVSIFYSPSVKLMLAIHQRKEPGEAELAKQPVLLVGDCQFQPAAATELRELPLLSPSAAHVRAGARWAALPYASFALEWLASVLRERGAQRVAWLRRELATERNVRGNVAGRRFIHFATRAFAEDRWRNLFGAIVLTPGARKDDPRDDGYLTLAEITELPLSFCDLVALSVYSTNTEPEHQGEGCQSLVYGFLLAGARRMLGSNWMVPDESTVRLISVFADYLAQQIKAGQCPNYARALSQAKSWMRT